MKKFYRKCDITGKVMNEGYYFPDSDICYIKEESDLIKWLREQNFVTAEGVDANDFSDEDLKEWAFNDEIYFWTDWDGIADDTYFTEDGDEYYYNGEKLI